MPEGLSAEPHALNLSYTALDSETGEGGGLHSGEQPDPMHGFKAYYSFATGPVHFSIITTEMDFTNTSAQFAWLDRDLGAVDRSVTPWVVVVHHRQIFGWGEHTGDPVQAAMQKHLEPLYIRHGVNVVLTAHKHTYSRTCAMQLGQCVNKGGVVYVVDGTAGAYTGEGSQGFTCKQPLPPFTDPGVRALDCMWGWSELEASATELRWTHRRWDSGNVSDSFQLLNTEPTQ